MHTSRLGKVIVILLGAIGLLCVGGGHAHADSVNVHSSTVGSVSVTTNNNSQSSSSSSTVTTDKGQSSSGQPAKTVDDSSNNKPDITATASGQSQSPAVATSDDTGLSGSTSDTAPAKDTTPTVILAAGTMPPSVVDTGQSPSHVIYYHPQTTIPTIVGSEHGTPMTNSAPGNPPKPSQPTIPVGTSGLVSTAVAQSPVLKFNGGPGAVGLDRDLSLAFVLILMVTLASALIVSAFISFLRASGFATAPRGSSPHFNFAFPVSEFALSLRLKTNSLFRTPQLLLGSWWDQGGRI